jgi:hypothetical protein
MTQTVARITKSAEVAASAWTSEHQTTGDPWRQYTLACPRRLQELDVSCCVALMCTSSCMVCRPTHRDTGAWGPAGQLVSKTICDDHRFLAWNDLTRTV